MGTNRCDVLVTGAAGFIGSHTVDALLSAGHVVVGLDDLSSGRLENLQSALRDPAFTFITADVTARGELEAQLGHFRPAAVVHLAALVSVPRSIEEPELNFRMNVTNPHDIAMACVRAGVARLVFASSAAVYGATSSLPIAETTVTAPISPYGAAKCASEILLLSYARSFGFQVRCHRYFNVYGPRQDPTSPYSGVISRFLMKTIRGEALTVFGDGRQSRDFIHVRDVARANALAATGRAETGIANICTGRESTILDIVGILGGLFPGSPPPLFQLARPGDIERSVGTTEVAKSELAFAAEVNLSAGLEDCANWFLQEARVSPRRG